MPIWRIYHPDNVYTSVEERQAFSQSITSIYTAAGLPAFIGGRTTDPSLPTSAALPGSTSTAPFIRIFGSNIARKLKDASAKQSFVNRVDKAIKPWVQDKGYEWEYHFDETDRELWKISGFVPPQPSSEGEALWAKEGKALPYEKL
jgi:hypothetical protein